ncbi:sphingoid long-chain bases kinase 2, mitochondrial-like isoform X5 [Nymphaea colorata]|uniref:sphingoid long-chain bases kinase 2, mitochondrial-like isoform X5 n=1 Tax=Nymphaea colorata TaxID=210225 RepID=UPI00214EE1F6|nr:sphingoid long-chain bases kinase 2, mitochondrial-like isoform X5 [Nymphaea colorata]
MALPNQSKLIIQTSNWSLLVMAELAIKEGMDAVIAVGGDGCEWLLLGWKACPGKGQGDKCKTALGLIPLGTGSDFARTFGRTTLIKLLIALLLLGLKQTSNLQFTCHLYYA